MVNSYIDGQWSSMRMLIYTDGQAWQKIQIFKY